MAKRHFELSLPLLLISVLIVVIGLVFYIGGSNESPKTTETKAATGSCPYDSGQSVPLGSTETDPNNTENRWPISQYRGEYDIFGGNYFRLQATTDEGILTLTKNDVGTVDPKTDNFMGSMFGFKPKRLSGAYDVYYDQIKRDDPSPIKGNAPVLEVTVNPDDPIIKVPSTGYDIGGGYEGLVVFAADNRVTIHISRAEYLVGSGANNCNGGPCSAGYWIYVKDICVDKQIQDAYNSVKAAQEAAGADKTPIQLPMVRPGQILGKALNGKITVGVRDNGPFIPVYKPVYWSGVPEAQFDGTGGATPTTPPGGGGNGGSTATPAPTAPNTTDGKCTYIGDVDCLTLTPRPTAPGTTDGRCTYIGDVDCLTLTPSPSPTPICDPSDAFCRAYTPTPSPTIIPPLPSMNQPLAPANRFRVSQTIDNAKVCPAYLKASDNGCIYIPFLAK